MYSLCGGPGREGSQVSKIQRVKQRLPERETKTNVKLALAREEYRRRNAPGSSLWRQSEGG